jgi:hypothetical protein
MNGSKKSIIGTLREASKIDGREMVKMGLARDAASTSLECVIGSWPHIHAEPINTSYTANYLREWEY